MCLGVVDTCSTFGSSAMAAAPELYTPEFLADILAALKEVTKPYQLGIQLKIDTSVLKKIEDDYHGDIDRQKVEIIEYWLRNTSDASWTTVTSAVERMGGHDNLVATLKLKQKHNEQASLQDTQQQKLRRETRTYTIESCEKSYILILGKRGQGKSTVGNKISSSNWNITENSWIRRSSSIICSDSQQKNYWIDIIVQNGLFDSDNSIRDLPSDVSSLNLVLFVLKYRHSFAEQDIEILKAVTSEWNIGQISALVLTHCERLSEEKRGKVIEQFKKDHPSVAEQMGKGILTVGFPDRSHIQPGSQLCQIVEDDKKKLRNLIYLCDEPVNIPQFPQNETGQPARNETGQLVQNDTAQSESRQPAPNVSGQPAQGVSTRRSFRCLIL